MANKRMKDVTGDGKFTYADVLRMRGVKLKKQGYGGKVEYGLGGAVMGGINALMQGKGVAGALGAGAKGFVTPGSGITQGLNMAGNLMQNSQNPNLQNLGNLVSKGSNLASMFGLMDRGGKVTIKYAKDGMNTTGVTSGDPEGNPSNPPAADFLLDYGKQDINASILDEARDLSRARSDRESAFGTSSTDVFMPVGNIPTMPDPEPTEEPSPGMEPVEPLRRLGPKIIRRDTNRDIEGGTRKFEPEQDFDMDFIFDQTPLPRSDKDVRYSMYQKTMGVKDPRTGKYYYIDGARGFSGPKGKNMLSISSLPEDQRARALKAIEDQEMMFATQSDAYRRQRGL
jgi:hypothetical protein